MSPCRVLTGLPNTFAEMQEDAVMTLVQACGPLSTYVLSPIQIAPMGSICIPLYGGRHIIHDSSISLPSRVAGVWHLR